MSTTVSMKLYPMQTFSSVINISLMWADRYSKKYNSNVISVLAESLKISVNAKY